MPLFGERFAQDCVVRTNDNTQRDYQEFLKRFDPELNRELSDAELAKRKIVAATGTAHHPPSEYEVMMANERERREKEIRQRPAREESARKQKLAQFELAENLEEDQRLALGIETTPQNWDLLGTTRRAR